MVEENRLDSLQDEIKLLKAEVKNSLASVRDYLLNMELPSSEFSTILAALSGDNADPQKMNVDSHVDNDKVDNMPQPQYTEETPDIGEGLDGQPDEYEDMLDFEETDTAEEVPENTPEEMPDEDEPYEEGDLMDEDTLQPEEEMVSENIPEDVLDEDESEEPEEIENIEDENDEATEQEPELPLEEVPAMEYEQPGNEISQGLPKVNMLANLINWVAKARQEIGYEQLPTFLEVYGTTGNLSTELKEVIIHLAEIVKENSEVATEPEIWSQSILSLHGILTGGDTPLNPVLPSWVDISDEAEDEIIEVDKSKDNQAKLKLVFPNADGKSKEFCINLTPEENGGGSQ